MNDSLSQADVLCVLRYEPYSDPQEKTEDIRGCRQKEKRKKIKGGKPIRQTVRWVKPAYAKPDTCMRDMSDTYPRTLERYAGLSSACGWVTTLRRPEAACENAYTRLSSNCLHATTSRKRAFRKAIRPVSAINRDQCPALVPVRAARAPWAIGPGSDGGISPGSCYEPGLKLVHPRRQPAHVSRSGGSCFGCSWTGRPAVSLRDDLGFMDKTRIWFI